MKAHFHLVSLVALAACSNALYTKRDTDDTPSVCPSGAVISNTTLTLNNIDVQFATVDCTPSTAPSANLNIGGIIIPIPIFPFPIFPLPFPFPFPFPAPPSKPKPTKTKTVTSTIVGTSTTSSAAPTPTSINVCDVPCTDACGHLGDLPPISEDCQQIFDSINITSGSIAPTFDVQMNNIHQLTFGTCRVFFENFSNQTLTFCWDTLSQQAQAADAACFPPVQPVNSAGFCAPSDGSWQVG
ncbi:hypothetical protein BC629DRAFT_1442179 [Irpex lacteus]|nr:hypothetical protein BC629DRAFT_1442179 [Irpex lacteus]